MAFNNYILLKTNKLERNIAKLYVVFLPFMMISQLGFLKNVFGVTANYTAFVFHFIGLFLWANNEKGIFRIGSDNINLFRSVSTTILYLNFSSLLMAIVIQYSYGNYANETAFSGIAGMIIYFFHYLLMIFYNIRVFKLFNKEELTKILQLTTRILLAIAYFQVLVMLGFGSGIYDSLNIFGFMNPSSQLHKLSLTGSEGATAGNILGVFVFPFLLSKIIMRERIYIYDFFLWLIPLYFTHSTNAFILFSINLMVFGYFMIFNRKTKINVIKIFATTVLLFFIIFSVTRMTNILDKSVINKIEYLLFEKAMDRENGSTASRSVPLYINWGAFTEYPVFGVGNGLQGYFYNKYFPSWVLNVPGSDVDQFHKIANSQISNGSVFIPSLLSGYGIVGFVFIFILTLKFKKQIRIKKAYLGGFYYMYVLGSLSFIVMGFQGDAYGLYFAWFLLSIPFIPVKL